MRYINKLLFQTALLIISLNVRSAVFTYPGANDTFKSAVYEVEVKQNGLISKSFVYADSNTFTSQKFQMTDWNHWTCFSFSDPIEVKVIKLTGGIINSCKIYPISDNIQPVVSGNTVSFSISGPSKLHVALDGMKEDPLFIFADAPEVDVPSPTDANVVYWGPGVHDIGEHYPIKSNTIYYLEGGAYVKGSFLAASNATNVKIRGRGILSGIDIAHCGYNQCKFDKTAILLGSVKTSKSYVEGITITNPGQYCIQSYGGYLETTNVKCFGWWYETDGWVGGNDSKLTDSFFKVNDDVVKLYFSNMQIDDLVIYHQNNGAPFQFGWGSEQGANCNINNIDIIADESTSLGNNHSMLNCANGNASNKVSNIKFNDIRVDQNLTAIFGLNSAGNYSNIEVNNLLVRGVLKYKSYLNNGSFNNIVLKNISIGGNCIDDIDQVANLKTIMVKNAEVRMASCNGPFVTITSPVNGTSRVEEEWIEVKTTNDESKSKVIKTEIYSNNTLEKTIFDNSTSILLPNLTVGKNDLKVIVYDANNVSSISNSVTIQVNEKEKVCNYKFEGNGFDETGRFNGWMDNGDIYDAGKSGLAPVFDGVNDKMKVRNQVFGNFTYAFWLKTTTVAPNGEWKDGIGLIDAASTGEVSDFGIMQLSNVVAVGIGNPDQTIMGTKAINDGIWHHVAVTRNTNTGKVEIYIDGILDISVIAAKDYRSDASYISIGASQINTKYFSGMLDELNIYNYVLSSGQINDLINLTSRLSENRIVQFQIVQNQVYKNITVSSNEIIKCFKIVDLCGSELYNKTVKSKDFSIENQVFPSSGIYLLSCQAMNGTIKTIKMLVQN